MREPGAHMAVCEDGSFQGSLSGGCIENAVVSEAIAALVEGKSRTVRFGKGSRYLDVRLPCGGGIDVHVQPLRGDAFGEACVTAMRNRAPFSVKIAIEEVSFVEGWNANSFDPTTKTGIFGHWPRPRLLIIGHGASVEALAKLSITMDCDVEVLTPDERIVEALGKAGVAVSKLAKTNDTHLLSSDPWTAIVFLFHDHDWEIELMQRALRMPHFYIGAMGGRKAHAMRAEALAESGVNDAELATIHAPIGLFHSSRDPQTLALSAFAEVIKSYQHANLSNAFEGSR